MNEHAQRPGWIPRLLAWHPGTRFRRLIAIAIVALLAVVPAVATAPAASSAVPYTGKLTISNATPAVGETVTFRAIVQPNPRNYRFHFGDRSVRRFAPSATTTKKYTRAGTYTVVVDVAAGGVRAHNVARVTVTVGGTTTPTPPSAPPTSPAPPGPQPELPPAGQPFIAYSADSFFRSPVTGAPVDTAATSAFRSFMATHPDQKGTRYPVIRGVDGNAWGTAYAEGKATDPVWRLTGSVPAPVAILKTKGFHAPEWFGAMLTGTSDSPFVVVDRATGWSIWGAKSKVVGDHLISVGAAGLYEHSSNGLDKRNPRSNSDLNFRSRGAIPDAMVIRKDLVDHAMANGSDLGHVLHLFIAESDSSAGYVHPMVHNESDKRGFGAQGQRIAIDPRVDLTKRGLSPEGLVIARTLQKYGAYIGDNSGGATALKAEQENGVRDVWDGQLTMDTLKGVTWDDFIVLPEGWQR